MLMLISELQAMPHFILIIPNTLILRQKKKQIAFSLYERTPVSCRSDVFTLYVELHDIIMDNY